MKKLENKIAVITGGNSGIGLSTAKEFIEQGAKVVITGRKQSAIDQAVSELGPNATGFVSDAGNIGEIESLVSKVTSTFGKIDILFINAGVAAFSPIEHVTEEHFDSIVDVNFKGAFFTFNKFIPHLKDEASVILLTSVNATTGASNTSVYASSKAALHSLVKVGSTELAGRKIRVNAVSPGPINTPLFGKVGLDDASLTNFANAMQNRIPLKRFGQSEEVAKLVSFLASDDSKFITGSEYVIDGGININSILG